MTTLAPAPADVPEGAPAVVAAPGPNKPRRRNTTILVGLLPLALMLVFTIYPVLLLLSNSVHDDAGTLTLATWDRLFSNPVFIDTVWTTVRIASIVAVLCVILGTFLAIVIVLVPFRGTEFVTNALNVYLSFPSFLITLALVFVWGNVGMVNGALSSLSLPTVSLLSSQWGVILAEVIYFTPFALLPALAALQVMDTSQVEVAEALGAKPWRIVRRVIIPEILPSVLAGGSLVLLRAMNEFGIVLFTGAKGVSTLPTLVYGQAIGRGNYGVAAVAAVVNIALSLGLYILYRQVTARALGGSRAR